eukprot:scaffold28401_cov69-Phaeocystis_antarctica.AAC.4
MALLTVQAGVTLGLAQSVSAHFEWGPDFAASIVAVVVCNQVVGPPLFKHVIRLVGEQHHNYDPLHAASNAGSNPLGLGNTSVEVTGRPQARGALVIAPDGAEQSVSRESVLATTLLTCLIGFLLTSYAVTMTQLAPLTGLHRAPAARPRLGGAWGGPQHVGYARRQHRA